MWNENYRSNFDYPRLAWDLGFNFASHNTHTSLDRGKLNLVDIDKIVADRDIATVERYIPLIVQFKLDAEQVKILDPNFVKVFRLSQLSVEYLIFCKKYLDNTVVLIRNDLTKLTKENHDLHAQINELTKNLNEVKAQVKQLETSSISENVVTFKCDQCHKVFASEDYLSAHVKRRHDFRQNHNPSQTYQDETNKLQLEIKELKERLNSNERYVQHHIENATKEPPKADDSMAKVAELQYKFDNFKALVETELKLFETHKNFQDKYEKLIEISLRSIKSDKNVGDGNVYEPSKAQKSKELISSCTQTGEINIIECHDEIDNDYHICKRIKSESITESVHLDLEKLQEKISDEACQHMDKVENVLEEKLAGHLEKIESHLDTFIDKLNQIEEVKVYSALEIINKMEKTEGTKAISVHRTKSSPELFVNNLNGEPEKPKKIRRKMEVASDSVISKPGSKCAKDLHKKLETIKQMRNSNEYEEKRKEPEPEKRSSAIQLTQQAKIKSKPSMRLTKVDIREDILEKLNTYLLELGVSPHWSKLPESSYVKALDAVRHRAAIVKKGIPVYTKIRQKIMCDLKKEVDMKLPTIRRSVSSASTEILHRKMAGKQIQKKRSRDDNDIIREKFLQRNVMYSSDTDSEIDFMFNTKNKYEMEKRLSKSGGTFSAVVQELKNLSQKKHVEEKVVVQSVQAEKSDTSIDEKEIGPLNQKHHMRSVLKNHPPPSPPPEPAVPPEPTLPPEPAPRKKVLFDLQEDVDSKVDKQMVTNTPEGGSSTSVTSSLLDEEFERRYPGGPKNSDISDWDMSD